MDVISSRATNVKGKENLYRSERIKKEFFIGYHSAIEESKLILLIELTYSK